MLRYVKVAVGFGVLALTMALAPGAAGAQVPTGTISGRVLDANGGGIPGAQVSLVSPSLQGSAGTVSAASGDYIFRLLPPGTYTVSVTASGFATYTDTVVVAATQIVKLNPVMTPRAVTETVNVSAGTDTFANTVESATSVPQSLLTSLPTTRSITAAVNLTPAAHATGPGGWPVLSGAMSFENLYLLNGVEIQDNLRGTPFGLYIEDAVQETVVGTSGISAEYGRFNGGIVNMITKSGGNALHATFRTDVSNDNWRSVSPYGEPKTDAPVPIYEGTVGGAIVQDKLWFFAAGRSANSTTAEETNYTRIPYTQTTDQQRVEGKLTGALGTGRRLEFDYNGIRQQDTNVGSDVLLDLNNLRTRQEPQNLLSAHYTGAVGSRLLLEGQFSARTFAFQHDGGLSTDRIAGTALRDQQTGAFYGAPEFCGVCGDERRDNDEVLLKGSYFLPSAAGAHNMVFGYDTYDDQLKGDNHQSGSDYQVWSTSTIFQDGTVYPVINSDDSTYIVYWPIRDASQGTNFRTHALFYNDTWNVNPHVTVNLGARWDRNHGRDASGNLVANAGLISPRLGVAWDPRGTGRTTFTASYGRYVAAIANTVANSTSPAGVPAILAYAYEGPAINTDAGAPLVPTAAALQQVFDWYDASGGQTLFYANIPGVASQIPHSLKSPHSDEISGGVSQQIGRRGSLRVDVVHRKFGDFYAQRIDTTTGTVADEFGQPFDVAVVQNTNALTRTYNALITQFDYRMGSRADMGGSYSLSHLFGNVDGEDLGTGPFASDVLSYPEYFDSSWSNPSGDLAADQRHRVRAWGNYNVTHRGVDLTLSALQQIESGTPYGAVGAVRTGDFVDNPGYALPPDTVSYYFTPRDAYRTSWMYRTDLAVNISRRLGDRKSTEVYARFDVLNLFNQFQLFNGTSGLIDTTVLTAVDDSSHLAPFNPFTQTPVEGVNWVKGDQFGQAIDASAYTVPRTFRFSFGVRY